MDHLLPPGALHLQQLSDLLAGPKDDNDSSDDDQPETGPGALGPGSIGPAKKSEKPQKQSVYAKTKKATDDIWDPDEVAEGAEFDDNSDPRAPPEYEIVYKQKVTSEDVFLGMGAKSPSTASCEDMVVKIKLPDAKKDEMELVVTDTFLDCRTKQYKLGLFLPHKVDGKNGRAAWDDDKKELSVTLTMKRELDFMNM